MWMHCNKCGVRKCENNTVKFFVGLCTHVLCENCSLSKICPIHKRHFNGTEVNNSMPKKLRIYFEDPNKLLLAWQKCIRFQCEQRTLCESSQKWTTNNQHIRKLKEELNVLNKYKATAIKGIEKDTKCINKMKAYFMELAQKQQREDFVGSRSINTTSTSSLSSTLALILNASNRLTEPGVHMDFYDLNSSN